MLSKIQVLKSTLPFVHQGDKIEFLNLKLKILNQTSIYIVIPAAACIFKQYASLYIFFILNVDCICKA